MPRGGDQDPRRDPGHACVGPGRRADPGHRPRRGQGGHAADRTGRDGPRGAGRGRGHLAVPGLPAVLRLGPVPGGHLHLGQRRRAARHPGPLPPDRRRPGQRGLRRGAGRLGRRRRGLLHHRAAAARRRAADRHHRGRAARRDRRRRARCPDRGHLGGDRRGRPRGRLRHLHRLRRSRRGPRHARGSAHPQRGAAPPRPPAGPGPGHRNRAVVPGRRQGQLLHRRRRLDHPQRRRQPCGPRRAHGGHHRRRPRGPDPPLNPLTIIPTVFKYHRYEYSPVPGRTERSQPRLAVRRRPPGVPGPGLPRRHPGADRRRGRVLQGRGLLAVRQQGRPVPGPARGPDHRTRRAERGAGPRPGRLRELRRPPRPGPAGRARRAGLAAAGHRVPDPRRPRPRAQPPLRGAARPDGRGHRRDDGPDQRAGRRAPAVPAPAAGRARAGRRDRPGAGAAGRPRRPGRPGPARHPLADRLVRLGPGAHLGGTMTATTMTDLDLLRDRIAAAVTDRRLTRSLVDRHLASSAAEPSLLLGEYVCLLSGGSSGRRGLIVQTVSEYADFAATINRRALAEAMTETMTGAGPPPAGLVIGIVGAGTPVHSSGLAAATAVAPPVRLIPAPASLPTAEIVRRLNAARPPALLAYAAKLAELAREQRAGRLRLNLRSVTSMTEALTPDERAAIGEAFGVPVIDLFVSTEGLVGHTVPDGTVFTFAGDTCLAECVDDEGRPVPDGVASAKVLVTNLHNLTQPLIRYELTDRFTPVANPAGGFLRASVDGRADDLFRYPAASVHPFVIGTPLLRAPAVREFQVRQTERGADLAVVVDGDLDAAALTVAVRDGLRQAGLPGPQVTLRRVEALDRDPLTGKARRFIPLGLRCAGLTVESW